MMEIVGFYKNGRDDLDTWNPFYSPEFAFNRSDDEVRFCTSEEDLIAALRAETPDIEPGYGFVYVGGGWVVQRKDGPVFYFGTSHSRSAEDYQRLRELARKYGEVRTSTPVIADDLPKGLIKTTAGNVRYDLKKWRQKQDKKQAALLTLTELDGFVFQLINELFPKESEYFLNRVLQDNGSGNLNWGSIRFLGVYKIAVRFHGVKKVHKTAAFRGLLARWGANRAGNVLKFNAVSARGEELVKTLEPRFPKPRVRPQSVTV